MLYCSHMKRHLKTILASTIIVATISAFAYYIHSHPEIVRQLKHTSPFAVVAILGVYGVSFWAYVLITRVSLRMYHKTLSVQENFLFNAYSSLVNFFGPGQSGPIFRGAYLKKRHNLGVRQFTFTVVLYLAFFAVINAFLMFVGSRPWWQTALLVLVVSVLSLAFIKWYKKRSDIDADSGLTPFNIAWLFGAAALQIASLAVVYGIELAQVHAHASVGQVLSYTGVANFSLYVAVTPGAIGIREAFLVFSQHLHHIHNTNIVAANLIDRAAYLLFLGLLFIFVLSLHAKDKLHVSQLKIATTPEQKSDS